MHEFRKIRIRQNCSEGRNVCASNLAWLGGLEPSQTDLEQTVCFGGELDSDPGERLAYHLRQQQDFSSSSCLKLLETVHWPGKAHRRARMQSSEVSQVLGQYSYGKFAGITSRTLKRKHTTQYLNEYMTFHGASGPRSSLAISRNARGRIHRDVNNIGLNYGIALGKFKGGDLWTEDDKGEVVRKAPTGEPIRDRLRRHHVEEWQGEQRWSIVAFQTRSAAELDDKKENRLAQFGFNLAGYQENPRAAGTSARQLSLSSIASPNQALDAGRPSPAGVSQDTRIQIPPSSERSLPHLLRKD